MVNPWVPRQYGIYPRRLIIPPSGGIINQPRVYPIPPRNPWVNLYVYSQIISKTHKLWEMSLFVVVAGFLVAIR